MGKIIAAIVLIGMLIGLGWGIHSSGYDSGVADEKVTQSDARELSRKVQAGLVEELFKERKKKKAKTNVKIKYIEKAIDPTGCLSTPFSAMGLQPDSH